jgi:hypothetical protein
MNQEFQKRIQKRTSIMSMEHEYERIAFKWLFITLAVLIAAYLYFVSASVLNVIARKEAMRSMTESTSAIASLEQRYFDLSQGMTKETAGNLGLAPVSDTAYVFRPGTVGVAYSVDDINGLEI